MFEGWTVENIFHMATAIVAAAAVIAAATNTPKDDEYVSMAKTWLKKARAVVDIVGMNWGGAKNDPKLKEKQ